MVRRYSAHERLYFSQNDGDNDNRGEVEFFPKFGFPLKGFFPFMNQKGYQTPFVFAKFRGPRYGAVVQMWCKYSADGRFALRSETSMWCRCGATPKKGLTAEVVSPYCYLARRKGLEPSTTGSIVLKIGLF